MTPLEAKAMVPQIEISIGMVGELTAVYDPASRVTHICMRDPMTGIIEPIATLAEDIPPDARDVLVNCVRWLQAMVLLREEAVRHFRQANPALPRQEPKPAGRKPEDPAQLASIWCQRNRAFRRFLVETYELERDADINATRACVRAALDITSFKELTTDPAAARRWADLKSKFQIWMKG